MAIYDERLNETLSFFEDLNDIFKVELDAGSEGSHIHLYPSSPSPLLSP